MFTILTIKNVPTRCMWASLLFCTVYNSYRYPLQINSAGTSPTYSDTPVSFQAAKFLVVLLLCLISLAGVSSRSFRYKKWFLAGFLAYLSLFPILKALMSDKESQLHYLEIAFWPLAALTLSLCAAPISVASLNRYFRFVYFYALLATAVEVLLFLTVGRLPALAYKGSFAIRFGGFLDDPNGFPALLYMLMGWSYFRYSGWKCFFAELLIVLCLLLSQSFTALSYLVVLSFLYTVYHLVKGPRKAIAFCCCVLGAITVIPFLPRLTEIVTAIIALKSASIDEHVSQNAIPLGGTLTDWLFGGDTYVPYESWWIGSLHNLGAVWYLLNLIAVLVVILSTIRAFFRASDINHKAVLAAVMMLSLYFLVANGNLPFFTVFPINFIFFCLSYLVLFGRIADGVLRSEIAITSGKSPIAMARLLGNAKSSISLDQGMT